MKVVELLEQQEILPRKTNDAAARKIASQLVRTAIKNFHGNDELPAAKKMAKGFYNNLIKYIETEYQDMKMKDISEKEIKLSLSENEHKVYNEKYYDADDWQEDHEEGTGGMSAICPKCGSHDVETTDDGALKARLHAAKYRCEDCDHESKWWGPDSHLAQKKLGGRGHV